MIDGQFIVVAPHITEGIVEGRLALFTLTARLEVVCLANILMVRIVLVVWFVSTIKDESVSRAGLSFISVVIRSINCVMGNSTRDACNNC
jgi:hypothetical protein